MKTVLLIITNVIIGLFIATAFIVLDEVIGVPKCVTTYFRQCDKLAQKIARKLK